MAEAAPNTAPVPVTGTDEQQQQRESYDSCASPIDGSASDPFLSGNRYSSPNVLSSRSTADLTVRQCTRNQAAFNIFLYMFGATQIPYAIGQMGWLWGSVFMVTMSVSSYHSGHLLADICVRRRAYSWPAIGLVGFGAAGQYAIEALQTTNFVLSGVVQTQGAGSVWQQAFDRSLICQWEWLLVSTAVFAVFLQIPSFGGSLPMKVATAITANPNPNPNPHPHPHLSPSPYP